VEFLHAPSLGKGGVAALQKVCFPTTFQPSEGQIVLIQLKKILSTATLYCGKNLTLLKIVFRFALIKQHNR